MEKRTGAPASQSGRQSRAKLAVPAPSRVDRLVELIDHCTLAKETADEIGEKLLSYLLSMAIQETRTAMRRTPGN